MRKFSFYASHTLAVTVFTAFYLFMLWVSIDMASQMRAGLHPTFWTEVTEGGLLLITFLALALVLMDAYTLFVSGHTMPISKTRSEKTRFSLPQAETSKS